MNAPNLNIASLPAALAGLVIVLVITGCMRSGVPSVTSTEIVTASGSDEQDRLDQEHRQALLERWNNPIATVIVTRDDITRFRDRRASDVLRRLPGVFVESAVGGRSRSARLRGLGGQDTQILINGERISGGSERRQFELDRIPADMIERIEIIKNPSAEYGSDAVAGVVNIVLRQAPDPQAQDMLDNLRREQPTTP